MVLLQFLWTFVFLATFGVGSDACLFSTKSDTKDTIFGNLVLKVLEDKVTSNEPHEIASAAQILFALALSNGLIETPDQVANFTTAVKNQDEKTIVAELKKYFEPNRERMYKLYVADYIDNDNHVSSLSQVMEEMLRVSGKNKNTAYRTEPIVRDNLEGKEIRKIRKFECEFDNQKFAYKENEKFEKQQYAKQRPAIYFPGNLGGVNLEYFLEDLKKIIDSVMESISYNDVDQLIRFVSEFKTQKKSLRDFYMNRFKVKFRPLEDSAVFEMRFLQALQETDKGRYKWAVDHFYLVNVNMGDTPRIVKEDAKLSSEAVDLLAYHHVAGAFRIVVDNTRIGYIIIDMNIGLNIPIVIMEDGKEPHFYSTKPDAAASDTNKTPTFHWIPKSNEYVQGHKYELAADKTKFITTFSYRVPWPYCNFLQTIVRPNVITPDHGMLKFHPTGFKRTVLNFRILPETMLGSEHHFNIVIYDEHGNETASTIIPFKDVTNDMSQHQIAILALAAQDLGLTHDLLWAKMVAVKLLIFDDDQLVEEFKKFNEDYGHLYKPKITKRGKLFGILGMEPREKNEEKLDKLDEERIRKYQMDKLVRRTHITNVPKLFWKEGLVTPKLPPTKGLRTSLNQSS